MRTRWPGPLFLCMLMTGCHLASNAVHNVTYEAKVAMAEVQEHCNYEKLARASWEAARTSEHQGTYSKDYADGFKDGFVDYLQFGGSGHPPYVPPQRFWGPHYRTPEGYRAIEDWYAGFRHGVSAAQQSGYRQWVTMPSALTTQSPPPEHPAAPLPLDPRLPTPLESRAPTGKLPPPILPPTEPKVSTGPGSVRQPARCELGAPVVSPVIPTIIQSLEPANTVVNPDIVQTIQPIATQKLLLIKMSNVPGDNTPRQTTAKPSLTSPEEADLLGIRATFGAATLSESE